MKKSEVIVKRPSVRTSFRNADMDLVFTRMLGVGEIMGTAHGVILAAASTITAGDPVSLRKGFHSSRADSADSTASRWVSKRRTTASKITSRATSGTAVDPVEGSSWPGKRQKAAVRALGHLSSPL